MLVYYPFHPVHFKYCFVEITRRRVVMIRIFIYVQVYRFRKGQKLTFQNRKTYFVHYIQEKKWKLRDVIAQSLSRIFCKSQVFSWCSFDRTINFLQACLAAKAGF